MNIDALGQHIGSGLVIDGIDQIEQFSGGSRRGFLRQHQMFEHFTGTGHPFYLLNGGETDKLLVCAGSGKAQCADPLGNNIQRIPLLGVLIHKHIVQAVELRAGYVPVKIVSHQIKGVTIGKQCRQSICNFLAIGG